MGKVKYVYLFNEGRRHENLLGGKGLTLRK